MTEERSAAVLEEEESVVLLLTARRGTQAEKGKKMELKIGTQIKELKKLKLNNTELKKNN